MVGTVYMEIRGMHCLNCPIKVEKEISKMNGIIEVDVNWESQKGCITFEQDQVTVMDMINCIAQMGFDAKELQLHI